VLLNLFYQPDIDLHTLDVRPNLFLSPPRAFITPRTCSRCCWSSRVTMLCSVLLQKGIEHVRALERRPTEWMEERGCESVEQMQGSTSQLHSADPGAFEHAQYMRALQTYGVGPP